MLQRPRRAKQPEPLQETPPVDPASAPSTRDAARVSVPAADELAIVLTGGGARAAYQVGVLSAIAERYPELNAPILTGVSAGAINAAHLAAFPGSFGEAVSDLVPLWTSLTPEQVFHVDARSLTRNVVRWIRQLGSGGAADASRVQGLVDTGPLRTFLERILGGNGGPIPGIDEKLRTGGVRALAISTTSYTTGQSVVWVQGRDIRAWHRPQRVAMQARISVDHIMASAALPLFFPAVRIGGGWYGDGGIRLAAPLSPALHLGASRILTVSTRYDRTDTEAKEPSIVGYPPPAQVLGLLMNSVFLDVIDQDAIRLERLNRLIEQLPEAKREGLRKVDLMVLRPSQDLGALAGDYEPRLPGPFRFMVRGLGTRETRSPDALSMIMFQADYLERLIELGRADAELRAEEIAKFLAGTVPAN